MIGGAAGALAAPSAMAAPALRQQLPTVAAAPGLDIVVRDGWAEGRPPRGKIDLETDVRCLLIHHTAEPGNDYGPTDVPALLRGMYAYHTGAEKGWPDIAYNFLIDQFGVVYEGRSGSLLQASVPDATGGSQGFSQLACFIGNFELQPPTDAALGSMDKLLAYLADRHGVDISPGATTDFISRGSNRYPTGVAVHTKTVAGHRDMSTTTCPGDAAYAMVNDNSFSARASAIRDAAARITTTTPPSVATASVPTTLPAATEVVPSAIGHEPRPAPEAGDSERSAVPLLAFGGAVALGTAAAVSLIRRRSAVHNGSRSFTLLDSSGPEPTCHDQDDERLHRPTPSDIAQGEGATKRGD